MHGRSLNSDRGIKFKFFNCFSVELGLNVFIFILLEVIIYERKE